MPTVRFTPNLLRHVECVPAAVSASTVFAALEQAFEQNPGLRGYILDEQDRLRKHVAVFVDGEFVQDRIRLSDSVGSSSEIYVMQALSGG